MTLSLRWHRAVPRDLVSGEGPLDELVERGVNLGPAVRLVYRLLPTNHDVQQVEVLVVAARRDLEAYALAAGRIAGCLMPRVGAVDARW